MRYLFVHFSLYICTSLNWSKLQAESLSNYQELLELMRKNSIYLKINQSRLEEKKHLSFAVSSFKENPELSVGIMNSPITRFPSISHDGMSGYAISLHQKFFLPWKKEALKKEAQSQVQLVQTQNIAFMQYLAYEVLLRYNRLFFAKEKNTILKQFHEGLENLRKYLQKASLTNFSLSLDFQKILQEIEKQKWEIKQNELAQKNYQIELNTFLGTEREAFVTSEDLKNVLLKNPSPELNLLESPLYQEALWQEELSKINVVLGKQNVFGEFSLEASYLIRKPTPFSSGEDMLSLAVVIPLPLTYPFKDKNQILALRKAKEQESLRLLQKERELELEFNFLKKKEALFLAQLEILKQKIVPISKDFLEVQKNLLWVGKKNFPEIIESFRQLQELRLEEIKLSEELCEIRLRQYYLSGKIFSL